MATSVKVLGQSNPSATTQTTLYTVPAATSTVVSSIMICNQSSTNATFRIAIQVSGASLVAQDYIYYNAPLSGFNTFAATLGLTLAATDVVSIYSSTSNLSFSIFGQETS